MSGGALRHTDTGTVMRHERPVTNIVTTMRTPHVFDHGHQGIPHSESTRFCQGFAVDRNTLSFGQVKLFEEKRGIQKLWKPNSCAIYDVCVGVL